MDIDQVVEWYERPRSPILSPGGTQELYAQLHPRTSFLKTLPIGSTVVDVGAGDGSLSLFRKWPKPERHDLHLYAYSLEKGEHFDQFDGYEIGDWNAAPPLFEGIIFDAIVCAHFIEHISDPSSIIDWADQHLSSGGRIYIEWPSEASRTLPPVALLKERALDLMISRFDDDRTHHVIPNRNVIRANAEAKGFEVEQEGLICLPWVEDQLMANFKDSHDLFCRQAAYWLATGWCQFLKLRKV